MTEQLPDLVPNRDRADRLRARCHKKLAGHTRQHARKPSVLERAIFLGFGAVYLSSIAFDVMRVLMR